MPRPKKKAEEVQPEITEEEKVQQAEVEQEMVEKKEELLQALASVSPEESAKRQADYMLMNHNTIEKASLAVWAEIQAKLAAPFPEEVVEFRPGATGNGKGLALCFVDARVVRDRFQEVLGPYWKSEHYDCGNGKLGCKISIRVLGEWISRTDGAGGTQVEAEKGAFSDAFKRAAYSWDVGRYLYDFPDYWVPMEGKRFTKDSLKKLHVKYKHWAKQGYSKIEVEEEEEATVDPKASEKLKANFEQMLRSCESHEALKNIGSMMREKLILLTPGDISTLKEVYQEVEAGLPEA